MFAPRKTKSKERVSSSILPRATRRAVRRARWPAVLRRASALRPRKLPRARPSEPAARLGAPAPPPTTRLRRAPRRHPTTATIHLPNHPARRLNHGSSTSAGSLSAMRCWRPEFAPPASCALPCRFSTAGSRPSSVPESESCSDGSESESESDSCSGGSGCSCSGSGSGCSVSVSVSVSVSGSGSGSGSGCVSSQLRAARRLLLRLLLRLRPAAPAPPAPAPAPNKAMIRVLDWEVCTGSTVQNGSATRRSASYLPGQLRLQNFTGVRPPNLHG